ncbi:hypothetical protein K1719_011803 [Acacia pycnantha]|nr:hypothetical protein K1719_011803 [Acacia pycnantha]
MTSSMLSGDRRWVSSSSKRGSMTVLGKVAIPKPINSPSQRFFVANIGDAKAVLAWSDTQNTYFPFSYRSYLQKPPRQTGPSVGQKKKIRIVSPFCRPFLFVGTVRRRRPSPLNVAGFLYSPLLRCSFCVPPVDLLRSSPARKNIQNTSVPHTEV